MAEFGLTVNGQSRPLSGAGAHTSALDWLRTLGLSGTKEGCAEGECGACAVLVAQGDGHGGTAWTSVNACLVPVAALDGQEIVTAEGLGTPSDLHPVQAELAAAGGSQCGYCTPGFACSMAAEFYRRGRASTPIADGTEQATPEETGPNGFELHALAGNLCRCTGYRPIRDAAYKLGEPGADDAIANRRDLPPPLPVATVLDAPDGRFLRPDTLAETLELLAGNPAVALVAGSTDWGVEVNLAGRRAPVLVAIDRVPELLSLDFDDDVDKVAQIGAAVTLSDAERFLAGRIPLLGQLFPQFASRLIRNRASLGGNLGTGSPIGDAAPALLALEASVVLASAGGEREVSLSDYFTGYRTTVRRADELIRTIRIPLPLSPLTAFHKITKRRFDDISSVAVAFALDIDDGLVRHARIGLGGVAATPLRARATEKLLEGKPWTFDTARLAAESLGREGTPLDDHRASAAYRRIMLQQAMLKLYASAPGEPTPDMPTTSQARA